MPALSATAGTDVTVTSPVTAGTGDGGGAVGVALRVFRGNAVRLGVAVGAGAPAAVADRITAGLGVVLGFGRAEDAAAVVGVAIGTLCVQATASSDKANAQSALQITVLGSRRQWDTCVNSRMC